MPEITELYEAFRAAVCRRDAARAAGRAVHREAMRLAEITNAAQLDVDKSRVALKSFIDAEAGQ